MDGQQRDGGDKQQLYLTHNGNKRKDQLGARGREPKDDGNSIVDTTLYKNKPKCWFHVKVYLAESDTGKKKHQKNMLNSVK